MTRSLERPAPDASALQASTLWITVERAQHDGRACRDHTVRDASGTPLLVARAFPWDRRIVVRHAHHPDAVLLILRRRVSFPLTGKIDVLDASGHGRLGVVQRNGAVRDAHGAIVGRFADARSGRRRTAEALVEGLGNAIVGGDGTVPGGSSASAYMYLRDGRVVGRLTRGALPFDVGSDAPPSPVAAGIGRILPRRLRDALLKRQGSGWRFERDVVPPGDDPRLAVGGALFRVELSHW